MAKKKKKAAKSKPPISSTAKALAPALKAVPGARYRTFAASGDLVEITIESEPKEGMVMRFGGTRLTSNPQVFHLPQGEYLLEWSFTGPGGAGYQIEVTGARAPTKPLTGAIAADKNIAAGTYHVLV